MSTPTVSWDETSPAGSQSRALGDDRIRELKIQLREVVAADHIMSSSGNGATWGYHNWVTFYNQGSNASALADAFRLFAKDANSKSELHFIDEDGNTMQLTSGGNFVGGIQFEIRMWSGLTANVPTGWVLCDGNNSTPDLTSKFVMGTATVADRSSFGGSGGANTTTLTTTQMAAHTHDVAHNHSSHVHTINHDHGAVTSGNNSASHTHTGTTAGQSVTHTHSAASLVANTHGYITSTPYGSLGDLCETTNTGNASVDHTHTITTGNNSATHTHSVDVAALTGVNTGGTADTLGTTASGSAGSGTGYDSRPAYLGLMYIMKS